MASPDEDERIAARQAGDPETWDRYAINILMTEPQGRRWMERLLDLCGAHHALYGNDGDALGMAWRDGKAEIGRYLETQLQEHAPDRFMQMIRERRNRFDKQKRQADRDRQRREGEEFIYGSSPIEDMADRQKAAAQQPKKKDK